MTVGRTIAVVFDHGEDFYTALHQACRTHGIRLGYIPVSSPVSAARSWSVLANPR